MTERRLHSRVGIPRFLKRRSRPAEFSWQLGGALQPAGSDSVFRWTIVASLTFLAGQANRLFQPVDQALPTLIFAPGCLLPFFLWWGPRYWTAVVFGTVATMLLVPELRDLAADSLWISVPALAGVLAFQLWLTAWLLERWNFRIGMERGRDALLFLAAAVIGTALSGWGAIPIFTWPRQHPLAYFVETSLTLWLMHAASVVVFAPAWLAWGNAGNNRGSDSRILAAFGLIVLAASLIEFKFWNPLPGFRNPLIYLGLPIFVLAPLLAGSRGAAVVTVLASLVAGLATAIGQGPFVFADPLEANFRLNSFLAALGLTTYSVAAIVNERRRALSRLEIDHSLLANAEKIAGIGSWQYDVLTGAEQWSDEFYRLLKLIPGEIAPDIRTFQERFVVLEDLERFRRSWDAFIRTGQPSGVEYRVMLADESLRIFRGQAEIQRDHHGTPVRIVGTIRDVTEARRTERLKEQMQVLLTKAEEMAHLGSWEIDGSGNMRMWSENMYRICGVARDQFDGRFATFVERLVHPEDRQQLIRTFQSFADGGEGESGDFRIIRGDGQVRDLHAQVQVFHRQSGQLAGCFGTTTDVTERKQAERRLRESERRYRLLAEHASDMIVCIADDGSLTYVSPASRIILGYEPVEIAGRPFTDLVCSEDRDDCRETMNGLLAAEDRPLTPFRGVRKDGAQVWLESTAQLVVDETGKRELLCVIRDITQRRLWEEQIAEAQRLEAVGRLAGGVAHDFNNILMVINGYAEVLETRFTADDPASKYVASILEAGRRAAHLTQQLLTYSRKQIVTRSQVDFNEVVRKLESFVRPLMGEGIELSCRLDPEIRPVEGDVRQFEQLMMNLAINARDAMPDDGLLTLKTENVVFAQWEMRPGTLRAGRYVKVTVSDTGVGMEDSVRARMFEPFFTTKGEGQGTGLGLATAYATMDQIGGAILVDSAPGKGTRFDLYFPCCEPPAQSTPTVSPPQTSAAGSHPHRRILVVEDDPSVRSLVELTLREARYEVVTASEGNTALGALADAEPPFDLLLTDVVMKGMNGRELAERIRQRHPQLPVIFMSGHTEDSMVRCGVLNDEVKLLYKPFTAAELMGRIQETLSEPTP